MKDIKRLLELSEVTESILWATWFKYIAGALYIETLIPEVAKQKPIKANLPQLPNDEEVDQWALSTYDVYHPIRNNVELLDSIEKVRVYLKDISEKEGKSIYLHNILEYVNI